MLRKALSTMRWGVRHVQRRHLASSSFAVTAQGAPAASRGPAFHNLFPPAPSQQRPAGPTDAALQFGLPSTSRPGLIMPSHPLLEPFVPHPQGMPERIPARHSLARAALHVRLRLTPRFCDAVQVLAASSMTGDCNASNGHTSPTCGGGRRSMVTLHVCARLTGARLLPGVVQKGGTTFPFRDKL